MLQRFHKKLPGCAAFFSISVLFLFFPGQVRAWGRSGTRLVLNKAIETLPSDDRALRDFLESNRTFLLEHVTDPLDSLESNSAEKHNHYIYLDKYGRFPFELLPRSYKLAVDKYGKAKLFANGLLPWQIGVYSQKLTEAMKTGRWEEAKLDAALLANYVAEASDPFNTTENRDGKPSGQTGINERFGGALVDRYSSFFPMRPNDAVFIDDPTDHAFEACLSAHSSLESILLADRDAHRGKSTYNDEYYDHFYSQTAATLIRQLSSAATDVGSYWLTAWKNAGSPPLPH
jgi:hypothetical protein